MKTIKTSILFGIIMVAGMGVNAQSQLTPSPKSIPPTVVPTNTTTPVSPNTNQLPGSTTPYTTPPVKQQTSPPVTPNPPPFPAGPTYTTTPAKQAPFPPDPK